MTMVAGMPSSRAASAVPWAWLPDENATTPARRCSGLNLDSALNAPRNLNAPMRCRFSHLKKTSAPSSSFTVREVITGVLCACLPCVSAPTAFRCVPGRTAAASNSGPAPGVAVITMSLAATAALASAACALSQRPAKRCAKPASGRPPRVT